MSVFEYVNIGYIIGITVLIFILLLSYVLLKLPYSTHTMMSKNHVLNYGEANYKTFKKYFDDTKWVMNPAYKDSLFVMNDKKTKIHAGLIEFNGKGMVITNSFQYYLVTKLINKKLDELRNDSVKW